VDIQEAHLKHVYGMEIHLNQHLQPVVGHTSIFQEIELIKQVYMFEAEHIIEMLVVT